MSGFGSGIIVPSPGLTIEEGELSFAVATQAELDAVSAVMVDTSSPVALTQTYATASAVHALVTATPVNAAPALYSQAEDNAFRDQYENLRDDVIALKQFVNTIADQLQAKGLAS